MPAMRPLFPILALGSLTLGALTLGACKTEPSASSPAEASAPVVPASYDSFGEAVTDTSAAMPVDSAAARIASLDKTNVTVAGTVSEVCQKAGCWATLQTTDGRTMRVNVAKTDSGAYRFTMPKDIAGRRVIVSGYLEEATLPAKDAEHLAEDAGVHDSTKTYADTKELRLTASGVLVRKA